MCEIAKSIIWTLHLILTGLSVDNGFGQTEQPNISTEVSYTNDIRPIVKNFCVTCHAGENPEGEFVLTSYDEVRRYTEKGALLKRINDAKNPMPQSGLMPAYMRRMFQQWAAGGYVNKGTRKKEMRSSNLKQFKPPTIEPVDVDKKGFEMLEYMQGHWVGSMNLMGRDFDWMAFDYRAISPSHVHGLFEGGTIGNLFTSFFVAKYKGKKTIMARNGGVLNGIYRTSYFVLDKVEYKKNSAYYRFVDAYGGKEIMWMDLVFTGNKIRFDSYTSRLGLTAPKLHMSFRGTRKHPELADAAAKKLGFPKSIAEFDFSRGLPKPNWGSEYPLTSATYLYEGREKGLVELGKLALDPIRIDQMPYVSRLKVTVERKDLVKGKKLHLYLSRQALTDKTGKFKTESGYIRSDLLDGLLLFPEISGKQNEFTFTYLHPGKYYLTVVADMDADGFPSPGDVTHPLKEIEIKPKSNHQISIENLNVRN